MSSKKSWLNKTLIINDLKSFWWAGALIFISLLFILTLPYYSGDMLVGIERISVERNYPQSVIWIGSHQLVYNLSIMSGILLGVILFGYSSRKKSSEFIAALPLRSKEVFFSKVITGAILFVPSQIINYFLVYSLIDKSPRIMSEELALEAIGRMFIITTMVALIAFFVTVFIGGFTTSLIATPIFTVIFILLPGEIRGLINGFLEVWVLNANRYHGIWLHRIYYKIMPLATNEFESSGEIIAFGNGWGLVCWGVFKLILLAGMYGFLAYFIFRRRRSEDVGKNITLKWMVPILKYGFTICSVMLVTVIFSTDYYQKSFFMKVTITLLAGIIAYYAACIFIHKSFTGIFKRENKKGLIIFMGISIALIAGLKLNLFRVHEQKVDLDEVYGVSFECIGNSYRNILEGEISDGKKIRNLKDIVDELVKLRDDEVLDDENSIRLQIEFKAYGGKYGSRNEYRVNLNKIDEDFKEIFSSNEVKEYMIQKYKLENAIAVDLMGDYVYDNEKIRVTEKEELDKIIKAYREDLAALTFDEMMWGDRVGRIKFYSGEENHQGIIKISSAYKNVIRVIKEIGLYSDFTITSEEIEEITFYDESGEIDTLRVKDEEVKDEVIKVILADRVTWDTGDKKYIRFRIDYKDGRTWTDTIDYEKCSDKLKEVLKRFYL